jgi:hypothetical protein
MNPAVEKLLAGVQHPILRSAFLAAVKSSELFLAAAVPDGLLAPTFIFACAARELGASAPVDDFGLLRKRTDEEGEDSSLVAALLRGAAFSARAPSYSAAATANCGPGEVRIQYLPIGASFRMQCPGYSRAGTLLDKTPSRAVVAWEGGKAEREFTTRQGATVTIVERASATGCCLETPVIPVYSVVPPEYRDWAINAYKELVGTFEENPKEGKNGKPKRKS